MFENLYSRFYAARDWVRAMDLYSRKDSAGFLGAMDALAWRRPFSPYQLAVRANALSMTGRYAGPFSVLSQDDGKSGDGRYIAYYARAMISDINGDTDGFSRNAAAASRMKIKLISKFIYRRNLPL